MTRWTKADVQSFDSSVNDPSKALKALVRGGIPAALRPDLWLRFSGGLNRKAAAPPAYYASLQRRAALAPSGVLDAAELAVELSRAFGAHAFLSSAKGLRSVLRLLEVCLGFRFPQPAIVWPESGVNRSPRKHCVLGCLALSLHAFFFISQAHEPPLLWT